MPFLHAQDPTYVGVDAIMEKVEECFILFPKKPMEHQDSSEDDQEEIILQDQVQDNDIQLGQELVQPPVYDVETYRPWDYSSMALESGKTGSIR
jgi:hypothetical protein